MSYCFYIFVYLALDVFSLFYVMYFEFLNKKYILT